MGKSDDFGMKSMVLKNPTQFVASVQNHQLGTTSHSFISEIAQHKYVSVLQYGLAVLQDTQSTLSQSLRLEFAWIESDLSNGLYVRAYRIRKKL